MLIGYARVSTSKQDTGSQVKRLEAAGVERVFEDVMSGSRADRPGLAEMLAYVREGDTVCVVRLDRLGRSLKDLLEIVEGLSRKKVNISTFGDATSVRWRRNILK